MAELRPITLHEIETTPSEHANLAWMATALQFLHDEEFHLRQHYEATKIHLTEIFAKRQEPCWSEFWGEVNGTMDAIHRVMFLLSHWRHIQKDRMLIEENIDRHQHQLEVEETEHQLELLELDFLSRSGGAWAGSSADEIVRRQHEYHQIHPTPRGPHETITAYLQRLMDETAEEDYMVRMGAD
jgi:hypothetical protein